MYIIKYHGKFGFIKPWTAVRDASGGETFSQQFLTPSIVEGIRQKLGVSNILRHKLCYKGLTSQQEAIIGKTWKESGTKKNKSYQNEYSIIKRGVMLDPLLYLAFPTFEDARSAAQQHICLCRNEDIMLPEEQPIEMSEEEFDKIDGFELRFDNDRQLEDSFLVGYNRFENAHPMYGRMEITGNPIIE